MNKTICHYTDILIIGSGISGLSAALRLASFYKIILISKNKINECASYYAQGGIASVFNENDSIESHIKDTLNVGLDICEKSIVEFIISNSQKCIQWLAEQGISFDMEYNSINKNKYHLTKEGGHSHRRILHCTDFTGKEIETKLINLVLKHKNIFVKEFFNAIDLIVKKTYIKENNRIVIGTYVWNIQFKRVEIIKSKILILATGGASKVYKYSTNPDISTGDGIAMAWRAGCRVANLEFNQFHPTCLFHKQSHNFLLTEALRGEGAYLKRYDGTRFMKEYDSRYELAPRDIVVLAMNKEMNRLGVNCMYLDITHKSSDFIKKHFPGIYKKLMEFGLDLTKDSIPVVPAAHYTCGGVIVNKFGMTDIENLYAIGEVAYTGFHGANRMASNSLLECLVYAWSSSENIINTTKYIIDIEKSLDFYKIKKKNINDDIIKHDLNNLKLIMWDHMGVVRTTSSLKYALNHINLLKQKIFFYYSEFKISSNLLDLRNLVQVSELMIRCALNRKESRGLHHILDYPTKFKISGPTILIP
ncbi:L-aspartate oxidase [Candidatus Providencia siddallii]|uniref:L-aspartate oxidase n=1 Tax=Candidatus Providencia siddallii TaxID=1715285 RepID=A0ABM9NPN7_9GAMM